MFQYPWCWCSLLFKKKVSQCCLLEENLCGNGNANGERWMKRAGKKDIFSYLLRTGLSVVGPTTRHKYNWEISIKGVSLNTRTARIQISLTFLFVSGSYWSRYSWPGPPRSANNIWIMGAMVLVWWSYFLTHTTIPTRICLHAILLKRYRTRRHVHTRTARGSACVKWKQACITVFGAPPHPSKH